MVTAKVVAMVAVVAGLVVVIYSMHLLTAEEELGCGGSHDRLRPGAAVTPKAFLPIYWKEHSF